MHGTQPDRPRDEPSPGFSPINAAAALWGLAFAAGLAVLLIGAARVRWILHRSKPAPAWLVHPSSQDAEPRSAPVRVTAARCRPFCVGLLRPTIVIPEALCREDLAGPLQQVLRHEQAHALRGDSRSHALFALALPLLALHPLFWMLRRAARFASELIADEIAAGHAEAPSARSNYARCLIRLAEEEARLASPPLITAAAFGPRSEFSRRIEMLMNRKSPLAVRCSRGARLLLTAGTLGALAATAAVLGATPIYAQDASEEAVVALRHENLALREQNADLLNQLALLNDTLSRLSQQLDALQDERAPDPLAPQELQALKALGYLGGDPDARTVEVGLGDTLTELAKRHLGSGSAAETRRILDANPGLSPSRLRVGQRIRIPARANDTAPEPARTHPRRDEPRGDEALNPLSLANRLIELEGERTVADLRRRTVEQLFAEGRATDLDRVEAQVVARTIARKREILERFAVAETFSLHDRIAHLEETVAHTQKLAEQGFIPKHEARGDLGEIQKVRAMIEALDAALKSDSARSSEETKERKGNSAR